MAELKIRRANIQRIESRIVRLSKHVEQERVDLEPELLTLNLEWPALVNFSIDLNPLSQFADETGERIDDLEASIDERGIDNLWSSRAAIQESIEILQARLNCKHGNIKPKFKRTEKFFI